MVSSRILVLVCGLVVSSSLLSFHQFDSRSFCDFIYLPRPIVFRKTEGLYFDVRGMIQRAEKSYNQNGKGQPLFGLYSQNAVDTAAADASGAMGSLLPSSVRQEYTGANIQWNRDGWFEAYSVLFSGMYFITPHLELGARFGVSRINSFEQLVPQREVSNNVDTTLPSVRATLRTWQQEAHAALEVFSPFYRASKMSDVDLYMAYNDVREYELGIRAYQWTGYAGLLIPTQKGWCTDISSYVKQRGFGRIGGYVALDGIFEIKRSISAMFQLCLSKRRNEYRCVRLPLENEPISYGRFKETVGINPGITFSAYGGVSFRRLRSGLGATLGYGIAHHSKDTIRAPEQSIMRLATFADATRWTKEYIVFDVFYESVKRPEGQLLGGVAVRIPRDWFATKNVFATYGVMGYVQYQF